MRMYACWPATTPNTVDGDACCHRQRQIHSMPLETGKLSQNKLTYRSQTIGCGPGLGACWEIHRSRPAMAKRHPEHHYALPSGQGFRVSQLHAVNDRLGEWLQANPFSVGLAQRAIIRPQTNPSITPLPTLILHNRHSVSASLHGTIPSTATKTLLHTSMTRIGQCLKPRSPLCSSSCFRNVSAAVTLDRAGKWLLLQNEMLMCHTSLLHRVYPTSQKVFGVIPLRDFPLGQYLHTLTTCIEFNPLNAHQTLSLLISDTVDDTPREV